MGILSKIIDRSQIGLHLSCSLDQNQEELSFPIKVLYEYENILSKYDKRKHVFSRTSSYANGFQLPIYDRSTKKGGVLEGELAVPYCSNLRMMFLTPLCSTMCECITAT